MMTFSETKRALSVLILLIGGLAAQAQPGAIKWSNDGNSFYKIQSGEVVRYTLPGNTKSTLISQADLTPTGQSKGLSVRAFYLSNDQQKALIYTDSKRVWRLDTK